MTGQLIISIDGFKALLSFRMDPCGLNEKVAAKCISRAALELKNLTGL